MRRGNCPEILEEELLDSEKESKKRAVSLVNRIPFFFQTSGYEET